MSTLKVTNIQSNGAGFNDVVSFQNSSGTQNGVLCRTWVNFDGTSTVSIRASFNVSSITDNGTGDYTVNFTTAMADAEYSASLSCQGNPLTSPDSQLLHYARTPNTRQAPTTSSSRVSTLNSGTGAAVDRDYVCFHVFR